MHELLREASQFNAQSIPPFRYATLGIDCNSFVLTTYAPPLLNFFYDPQFMGMCPSKKETLNSMPNLGTYFEIPVTDFERAVGFYEAVFLCEMQIQNIDGNQMAVFPGSPKSPGIIGALAMGSSYKPSMDGSRIYLHTEDIDATLQLVVANGGRGRIPEDLDR